MVAFSEKVTATPLGTFDRPMVALIVDRNLENRVLCAQVLRQCGCEIEEAHDGRQALAQVFSRRPDLIITSTTLAGMSGFDLCRMLRLDALTASIPIVMLTGDGAADGRRALSAGADSVLPNPCPPGTLLAEIRALLSNPNTLKAESKSLLSEVKQRPATDPLFKCADAATKRVMLSHVHGRRMTTTPGVVPPLLCPLCSRSLKYLKSYLGGVSAKHPERWDYFECQAGCGTFQYRHRTRKLRHVD